MIDTFGIKHAYNGHGKDKETNRGQIPLNRIDFKEIPKTVYAADTVIKGGFSKIGKPTVLFEKEFDGIRVAVFEVLFVTSKKKNKKPKLMFKTYYIKKALDN